MNKFRLQLNDKLTSLAVGIGMSTFLWSSIAYSEPLAMLPHEFSYFDKNVYLSEDSPIHISSTDKQSVTNEAHTYPMVESLKNNVQFWKKVYAVWSVNEIAFHDREDFELVYTVAKVAPRAKPSQRRKDIKIAKANLVKTLKSLNKKRPKNSLNLSGLEKEVFENIQNNKRKDKFQRFKSLRMQNGLRERFESGYKNAGFFQEDMEERLSLAGLNPDIIALAYVESLMVLNAESYAGAVGPWQFMPATGREYMQVHDALDERNDPILASDAAAKYLLTARKNVGPWPAAITSYNFGRSGMKKGMKAAGSKDFNVILKRFKSKRFGFAARNYYASFLAVHDVLVHEDQYFSEIDKDEEWDFEVVRLPFALLATQLVNKKAISMKELRKYNPAVTYKARKGVAVLPAGLPLRVPAGQKESFYKSVLSFSPNDRLIAAKVGQRKFKCNGKKSIKKIAKENHVSADMLAYMNHMTISSVPKRKSIIKMPTRARKYSLFPEAKNVIPLPAPRLPGGHS